MLVDCVVCTHRKQSTGGALSGRVECTTHDKPWHIYTSPLPSAAWSQARSEFTPRTNISPCCQCLYTSQTAIAQSGASGTLCSEGTLDWTSRQHLPVGQDCSALHIWACLLSFLSSSSHCSPSPETKAPTRSEVVTIAGDSLVAAHVATSAAGCGLCDVSNDSVK